MKKKLFLFIIGCFCFQITFPQNSANNKIKKITKAAIVCDSLPIRLNESSGLIYFRSRLWSINDSGDGPYIYSFDSEGKRIQQVITISNAKNIDWEEITQDNQFIYVGDVGNNFGDRNTISVYKIVKDSIPQNDNAALEAKIINLHYKKEINKSPFRNWSELDCEALVCIDSSLIFFSKNWEGPYCNIYVAPNKPGDYEITPYRTMYLDGLVTAASYFPENKNLILLGYKDHIPFIFAFANFQVDDIKKKPKTKKKHFLKLIGYQTEGIAFIDKNTAIFSSEYNIIRKGALFLVHFK